jgi:eukaryotic-like serine/threonine-protein kinase
MNSPHRSNPWIGRSLGDNQRYRLDKRLGSGGMGDVFLATDTRIGQQVALKLLKDPLVESPEMRTRFDREIAICAALIDEHIVKIMDAGVTDEGFPFYVMEYLRGETLGELLRREQQLGVDRAVKIITQVCNGLLLAHQGVDLPSGEHIETIVHRDLKPDNIFLQPTDLGEWVKILDFGIAKIRDRDDRPQTLTHTFLGTLRYASPEQMMGDRDLDARADIYSLGVILYEMLSGADPFGLNVQQSHISEASWAIAHTSKQPIALRSQPGCEHLAPELDAIALRCLEKNPELRFRSVAELNLALQAAIAVPSAANPILAAAPTLVRVTQDANDETTIAKAISASPLPIVSSAAATMPRSLTPLEPVEPPIQSETNIRSLHRAESSSIDPHAETKINPQPFVPPEPVNRPIRQEPHVPSPQIPSSAETIAQSRSPSAVGSQLGQDLTQVQHHAGRADNTGSTPQLVQSPIKLTQSKTLGLKLSVAALLGLGASGGIYLFTQSRPANLGKDPNGQIHSSPIPTASNIDRTVGSNRDIISLSAAIKLVNDNQFSAAIDLANKIPQTSPDRQKAQALSANAASLVTATKLANDGKIQAAIDLLEKISPSSPIHKKIQDYLKELKEI